MFPSHSPYIFFLLFFKIDKQIFFSKLLVFIKSQEWIVVWPSLVSQKIKKSFNSSSFWNLFLEKGIFSPKRFVGINFFLFKLFGFISNPSIIFAKGFEFFVGKGKLKSEIDEIVDNTCACKSKTGRELSECKNILEKQAENLDKRIKELSEN